MARDLGTAIRVIGSAHEWIGRDRLCRRCLRLGDILGFCAVLETDDVLGLEDFLTNELILIVENADPLRRAVLTVQDLPVRLAVVILSQHPGAVLVTDAANLAALRDDMERRSAMAA